MIWQKTYGGNNDDEADAVAIAENGDIVVAGTYGGYAWVLELDGNGNIVWQKAYRFYAVINAVAIDPNGNIIVAGTNSDFFVLKLNGNGDFEWGKSWGTSRSADEATSVAIDNGGDIVVAGYTWGGFGINGDFWVFRLDGGR
ncbi:NHL repeat-containing protein [Thermococcus peptonophilus]|uniref:hypothetical protein n=1 Tax=Thermococcus peptonophilus TaxID=53952 RepID=UPI0006D07EF1